MKAQIRPSKNILVEVEAETQKDLFKEIASAHEVFGEKKCGLCGCEDIVPAWRTVTTVKGKKTETWEYPEWHCSNLKCRARLSLGTLNDGSGRLFPNRKLLENGKPATGEDRDNGRYGPHQGWTRYRGEPRHEEASE